MSKQLPSRPNLDHLRDQAKALLSDYRKGDTEAAQRFRGHLPGFKENLVALHDAQSVIAREYGFPSWPKLVAHVEEVRAKEGVTPEIESQYIDALLSDAPERARRLLDLYPTLSRSNPTCALVSAEVDVANQVDPMQKLGPRDLTPIEYVAYSRIHTLFPDLYKPQAECARILLDKGADPNTFLTLHNGGKIPVLYGAAAESGHIEIVRLLLERGANPNDDEAIYHSAERGRLDVLDVLAGNGGMFGPPYEPLGFLLYYRDVAQNAPDMERGAQWLLEHGANPNIIRGEAKQTPLHVACRYARKPGLVELLLDHGADPTIRDGAGDTAYQIALAVVNENALRALEARGVREEPSKETAFLAACSRNDQAAFQRGRSEDPAIMERLKTRASDTMRQVAETGEAAKLLGFLAAGFPPAGQDNYTPLHFACLYGHAETVAVLIAHGAPLDLRDDEHHSPPIGWACHGSIYHRGSRSDFPSVVRQLIEAGSSSEDAMEQLNYWQDSNDVTDAIRAALAARQKSAGS